MSQNLSLKHLSNWPIAIKYKSIRQKKRKCIKIQDTAHLYSENAISYHRNDHYKVHGQLHNGAEFFQMSHFSKSQYLIFFFFLNILKNHECIKLKCDIWKIFVPLMYYIEDTFSTCIHVPR